MKAICVDRYGDLDEMTLKDVLIPTPASGQALIKIHAAGVNPVDWKVRQGLRQDIFPVQRFPYIPGWDLSGTVDAICGPPGEFIPGDAVIAFTHRTGEPVADGCYCEYREVDLSLLIPKPASLSHAQAASLPLAGLTAWQALCTSARLSAGERILIRGGAGGVGSIAIAIAKSRGAEIWVTARSLNHAYVKELGADHVLDYQDGLEAVADPIRAAGGVDVLFDCVGSDDVDALADIVKPGGRLVSIAGAATPARTKECGIMATRVLVQNHPKELAKIALLAGSEGFHPPAIQTLALHEAAMAQRLSRQAQVRGKLVLVPLIQA